MAKILRESIGKTGGFAVPKCLGNCEQTWGNFTKAARVHEEKLSKILGETLGKTGEGSAQINRELRGNLGKP